MSANASNTTSAESAASVNVQAAEESRVPKKIVNAQTVCNEKNEKGKLCNGHLKQLHSGGEEAEKHLRGDDILFKCQTCGTLYMGPPLGHVRDPDKQRRFVERELAALLQASGGTLPAIVKNERGVFVLAEETAAHAPAAKPAATAAAPAKAAAAKTPAPTAAPTAARAAQTPKPAAASAETSESKMPRGYVPPPAPGPVPGETQEQKLERLRAIVAEAKRRKAAAEAGEPIEASPAASASTTAPAAASTSGTDSSAQADAHRPTAEAQAATGQASAAPLSSAAATASPAAQEESATAAASVSSSVRKGADGLNRADFDTGPVPGETDEQKIARLRLVVNAARERAGKPPKY